MRLEEKWARFSERPRLYAASLAVQTAGSVLRLALRLWRAGLLDVGDLKYTVSLSERLQLASYWAENCHSANSKNQGTSYAFPVNSTISALASLPWRDTRTQRTEDVDRHRDLYGDDARRGYWRDLVRLSCSRC